MSCLHPSIGLVRYAGAQFRRSCNRLRRICERGFLLYVVFQQTPVPETSRIQDNSFLVEEAYNQESGVIQHINNFTRRFKTGEFVYSFTQEWPAFRAPKHQFSYTLMALKPDSSNAGLGDVALHYRYQLLGDSETRFALAPRFTVLLPAGDWRENRGNGGIGLETNLAFSTVLAERLISHTNAGFTVVPSGKSERGQPARINGANAGEGLAWLVHPRVNVLLETVWNSESVEGSTSRSLTVSPGIRWAYNFRNGLQVVPGVAIPIELRRAQDSKAILFYLSFEHLLHAKRAKSGP